MVRLCPRRMTRARYLPLNTTWKVIGYSIDPLKNISLLNQVVTKKTLKGSSANFFRTFNGLRLTFQVVFELTVGSAGRVSDFTEQLLEYWVAFPQAAAFAFTGTFVMAGTQACPRGELFAPAEALHINANLDD